MNSRAFTIAELLVVALILGILAALGIVQYRKTVENAHARAAASALTVIGATNRMFALDHRGESACGWFDSNCLGAACTNAKTTTTCGPNAYPPCDLIACKYFSSGRLVATYHFAACWGAGVLNDCCGLWQTAGPNADRYVACAIRKTRAQDPKYGTSNPAYANWGYTLNDSGVLKALNGAPSPP